MSETNVAGLLPALLALPPGATPFPWQERLLERFVTGNIPDALDLPTGLGKTKTISIWAAARMRNKRLPRRLVYVVDRRAVVDQATAEAEILRARIASDPALLRAFGGPLAISTLRGEHIDNAAWREDPSACGVIIGTVDMIGSKLIFQGYGVSRNQRPIHAGLLGIDTLFVVDESHLVPPFEQMLRGVGELQEQCSQLPPDAPLIRGPRVLALSATGGHTQGVFGLDSRDLEHPVVRQRLQGKKRLQLLEPESSLAPALAKQAWELGGLDQAAGPERWPRVIVFCNSRKDALNVRQELDKLGKPHAKSDSPAQTELLVGGMRRFERDRQGVQRLEELGFLSGDQRTPLAGPSFLICTSAGEVGVDLDADHMVSDLVQWERMVQRLGRVNRRGQGCAQVVVIPELGNKSLDLALLSAPVNALPKQDGVSDASIQALLDLNADPQRAELARRATTPGPAYPPLELPTVQDWAMTNLPNHPGRPQPAPWLRGWLEEDSPQTQVFWRLHMPLPGQDPNEHLRGLPPHPKELLTAFSFQVLDWLLVVAKRLQKAGFNAEGPVAVILDPDGSAQQQFTLSELLSRSSGGAKMGLLRALSGRTLLVSAAVGGLDGGLLEPKQAQPPSVADDPKQDWGLPWRVREAVDDARPEKGWREQLRLPRSWDLDGAPLTWLVLQRDNADQGASTEFARSAGQEQSLQEHQEWTEGQARRISQVLGLPPAWDQVLCRAARWHDQGKAAEQWQRFASAPALGRPFAKTTGPFRPALLQGYRHELGSLLHLQRSALLEDLDPDQRDLLLHIVSAHHGRARPTLPIRGCEEAPPSTLAKVQLQVAQRYARLQLQWGPWGLAWWESLLRAADVAASRANDEREEVSP